VPTISVVIPSWNGRALLDRSLSSLQRQTLIPLETIVVDNGSEDGTVAHLNEVWPQVRILALERNVGFAPAVNRGIAMAVGDFIALVNNDMELEERWLEELADGLISHPEAASATGKILDLKDPTRLDGAGDVMSWYGLATRRGWRELDEGQYDTAEPVFSACAGAALYRADALARVGHFDEDFFAYFEDVDWGFRAQLLGLECRYVPTAVSWHLGGATADRVPDFGFRLQRRNEIWLVVKNFPGAAFVRYAPQLALYALTLAFVTARQRRARVFWSAVADAVAGLPGALRKRRAIQRSCTVGLHQLARVVTPRYPLRHPVARVLDDRLFGMVERRRA